LQSSQITIVEGVRESLVSHPLLRHEGIVLPRSDAPIPWYGARALWRELASRVPEQRVAAALRPRRAILSLVLRDVVPDLDADELRERNRERGARAVRRLSATPTSVGAIASAWTSAMRELAREGDRPLRCIVPIAPRLDSETWGLFAPMLRQIPGVELVFGVPTDDTPIGDLDARLAAISRWELAWIEALPEVRVKRVDAHRPGSLPPCDAVAPEPRSDRGSPTGGLDDEMEEEVARRLLDAGLADDRACAPVLAAIEAAMDAFGFPAVVDLGRRLLGHPLPPSTRAAVEMNVALAMKELINFNHRAEPDDPWMREIRSAFASAHPTLDRGERVVIDYSSSLREGRGGDPERALACADAVLASVDHVVAGDRSLAVGYGLNARAYARYRRGETARAIEDLHAALAAMDIEDADQHTNWLEVGRFNVVNNLARLAFESDDRAAAASYLEQSIDIRAATEGYKPFYRWFSPLAFLERMEPAAERLELEVAASRWDSSARAGYSLWAGDLRYRLGHAPKALAHFEVARRTARTFAVSAIDVLSATVNCAVAAYRAGLFASSASFFEDALGQVDPDDAATSAELLAALAMAQTGAGDETAAREAVSRARERASSVDDPSVLARMHRSLAEVALATDRFGEAANDLASGLRCAGMGSGSGWTSPPEDVLGLLVGALEIGELAPRGVELGERDENASEALHLALSALDDPSTWWDLPRLLRIARPERHTLSTSAAGALDTIERIAVQREDCRRIVLGGERTAPAERVSVATSLPTST
jgi:tetratricopeptide (TPR) repeat protein